MTTILDSYIREAPSGQVAVDIFKSEWSSRFPAKSGLESGGRAALFEDGRIDWLLQRVGSLAGTDLLELGPLEAGHSYMLHEAGAASVLAVEANTRAYLKCLIVKELFALDRVRFLLGDFIEFLRNNTRRYDLALASGVIYHMRNPAELIELLSKSCRELFIWTHYFDPARAEASPELGKMFAEPETVEFGGFRHTVVRKAYGEAIGWAGFCGGPAEYACWMPREDLLACFRHFGFEILDIAFEQPDHPNGAALALHARHVASQESQGKSG